MLTLLVACLLSGQSVYKGSVAIDQAGTVLSLGTLNDGECLKRVGGEIATVACGGGALPSGAVILIVSGSCPAGFTEVASLAGKFLLGTTNGAGDVGTTGGSNNITPTGIVTAPTFTGSALGTHAHGTGTYATSAHAGTAVGDHASHTHTYTDVVSHTHTQDAHTHTQNAHQHGMAEGTTDGSGTFMDRSNAAAATTAVTDNATATNQNATATNQSTGIATGTTAGPGAVLTHSVTQPSAHTLSGSSEALSAGTPAGSNSAPTFTGDSFDNRPAWLKVIFCSAN